MKAKEYAEKYKNDPSNEGLNKLAVEMLTETNLIIKQRHARTNEAMFAVFDEQDQKWRKFCDLAGNEAIRKDGFERMIMKVMVDAYIAWKNYRRNLLAARNRMVTK